MGKIILSCTAFFQVSVFIITLYYMVVSLFGLYRKKECSISDIPEKSFAVIVAAHNEELVIAQIIESIRELDYPRELFDIFVVADNCSDRTADVAAKNGAKVFERVDPQNKGKGYALEWMFKNLYEMDRKYDAVVIFDADNLASRNFLKEMDKKLREGYKVVQGYLDSKNPHDSWISEAYSIAFWTSNRLFQLGRANLGLSNQIGGTGFCVETGILKEIGWGATCLTEDLEFTCKLILNGFKVGWAHDAVIYDEKPLTLEQSWRQRKRWMQGFADVASRFFLKLIKKAVTDRDMVALDCALYTLQPFVIVALGISSILTFVQSNSPHGLSIWVINYIFPPLVWKLFSIFQFLFTPYIMLLEKKLTKSLFLYFVIYSLNTFIASLTPNLGKDFIFNLSMQIIFFLMFTLFILAFKGRRTFRVFLWYLLYGVYILTWIPITIQGILNKDNKEWCHTKHTRQISINEIEGMDGRSAA